MGLAVRAAMLHIQETIVKGVRGYAECGQLRVIVNSLHIEAIQ